VSRIVITGGSGLLGLNWALARKQFDEVYLFLHKRSLSIDGINTQFVDLQNSSEIGRVLKIIKPDLVVHTAALTDVDLCEEFPSESKSSNVDIAVNVARQAFKLNIPLAHISTDHLFDGASAKYTEDDSIHPVNTYGCHKALAESLVQEVHPKSLIIRTCFFGWGPKYRRSFSDYIIDALRSNQNVTLYDDVVFSPINVTDLIRIVHELVELNSEGVFNVCARDSISKYEFGVRLAESQGLESELIQPIQASRLRRKVKRPVNLSLSDKKLRSRLNFKGITINDAIASLKNDCQISDQLSIIGNLIPYGRHFVDEDDVKAVRNTMLFGSLTQGPAIERFETKIAEYTGAKYAVAVSSATAGLHISYKVLGVAPSKTVLVSPITFVSTANAAHFCGSSVHFSDITSHTLNICATGVEKALNSFPDIHVVAPTLFAGTGEGISEVSSIAKSFKKHVVEDAAHGLGGRYPCGAMIGSCKYSDCTVFSLHPVKSIAAGEGGVVTTNDKNIYRALKRARSHGIIGAESDFHNPKDALTNGTVNPWYYEMVELGFHYRFTDIQATLATSQLSKLESFMERRRQLVRKYQDWIEVTPNVTLAQQIDHEISSNHLMPVSIDFAKLLMPRSDFMNALRKKGIITQVHYIPVVNQPFYERQGFRRSAFPNSQKYYKSALSLPLYYGLRDHEFDYVIQELEQLIRK